ncbi:MAG TPA: endonuclease/exonuclease/phosphatase family protein [Gemmataceae bacterium]|jgi:endonuclease/exonuclease/phosphatase family metal-dependent hydrolase|nr:endonuclease/exonuclease/phosphatase family protein [Gemmataceae bacterium]
MLHKASRKLLCVLAGPLLGLALAVAGCLAPRDATLGDRPDGYLFCFWNVENLFDDHDDHRAGADRDFDRWFAERPQDLQLKLDHLSAALAQMNDGQGPDILAVAEVESKRAAQLLADALNKRLPEGTARYEHVLMKELNAGRHIAPAILTRLPVRGDRTRLHGRQQRILEGHVTVNGHDLVVLASHWTSRVTDKDGSRRCRYGEQIYGTFRAMYMSNPKVDFLICGDFNDPPEARSVTACLRATGDIGEVRQGGDPPLLLDLFTDKDPNTFGTEYYKRFYIFDQIVVSPGLLDDEGWTCDPDSVETFKKGLARPGDRKGQPWRFGNRRQEFRRGYSDHFPVTVRLRVAGQ